MYRLPNALCVCFMYLIFFLFAIKVDLRHMDEQQDNNIVDVGVDLSEFYMSVEWDILEVPAVR